MYYKVYVEIDMSSLVSVRLNDQLIQAMKAKASILHLSQTDYIRRAIERLNDEIELQERSERMKRASLLTRAESMRVNAEFSEIDHDPDA